MTRLRSTKQIRKLFFFTTSALCMGIFLFWYFSKPAVAAWLDDNWAFRKAIPVTNNTTAEINVFINFSGDTAIDTSDTTRFQADCGDLRFTKQNGELLPYYIASGCGTATTVVHVNFDSFPAGLQTIYMYYGNPSAGNGFNSTDFSTGAANYTIGTLAAEEKSLGSIAYWKFDEGTGTTAKDSTANAANGTLTAGTGTVDPTLSGTTSPTATTGSTAVSIGTGADGACTVSSATNINTASCAGRGTADAINFSSTANTATSATAIVLTATSTGLAVGDEVLIINLKGTSGDNANVGQFETKTISSITTTTNADDTLNFATGLTNGYNGTTQKIMVQRVPNYTNVTINTSQVMTADAWDGTKNGVLFFRASGTVTVTGSINMSQKGFLGGAAQTTANTGGLGGTTYNGTGGNGGDAVGFATTGQGGGGGGGGTLGHYTGGTGATGGAGGGGGIYYAAGAGGAGYGAIGSLGTSLLGTHNGSNGSGTTGGNGGTATAGDAGGGGGGGTYGAADLTTLFLGSGGGGGGNYASFNGQAGGTGGGIIAIAGDTITVTGNIFNSGGNGTDGNADSLYSGGPGGGAAGGSTRVSGTTLTLGTNKIITAAGTGGVAGWNCSGGYDKNNNCQGTSTITGVGGAGGVGRIAIDNFAGTGVGVLPTWKTKDQCINEKCLYFNGNSSKITVANTINNIMSVSMWVKPTSVTSGALIDLDGSIHTVTISNGTLSANGFTSPTIYVDGKVSSTLVANQWQYVTVTTGTSFNSTSSLAIGNSSSTYLSGFIDEIKIYNYARTAIQVKTDFASRGAVKGTSAQIGSADQSYLSKGLIGYWKMEESSTPAVDSSGNGYSGTWNGNTAVAIGKFGNGATFDGTGDYIQTSNININFPTITISTWFKSNDVTSTKRILEHDWDNSGVFSFHQQTGHVHAVMYNASHTQMGDIDLGAVSTGTWYHIAQTYDGTTWKGYLNGQHAGTDIVDSSGLYQANKTLYLGARAFQYNGVLDETRMYNRALSPQEIFDLYNWAPGPIGYWNFEEGSGSTANDGSGNGYTGTWQGSTGTHWTNGKYGKATNFNGSSASTGTGDYISTALTMPTVGSMTFWYKATTATVDNRIIGAEAASSGVDGVGLSTNLSGKLYAIFRNNSTSGDIDSGSAASTTAFEHVGMTWGADGTKFYRNGVLVGSSTAITSITTGGLTLNLGTCGSGTCYRFNGLLDDVKVYNYVRSQKQIVSDMNGDHPAIGSPVGSSVGYWKLDEGNSTVANNSGNGGSALNGTLTNMTIAPSNATSGWTTSGKYNKGLIFDGTTGDCTGRCDDLINAGSAAAIDNLTANPMSLSAWIYPNTLGEGNQGVIMAKNSGATPSSGWLWQLTATNTLKFSVDGTTDLVVTAANSKLTMGAWNYVALSWDGVFTTASSVHMYVNGIEVTYQTQTNGATIVSDAASSLFIGNDSSGASTFDGTIDEVKIYNYSLTANEVKVDYNRGQSFQMGASGNNSTYQPQASNQEYCVPGDSTACLGPIGRWDLEEGKDNTCSGGSNDICDISTNGKDGTHGTGVTWTSGKYGKGMYFAASGVANNITLGDNFDITATDNMTWEVWFKSDGQNRSNRRGIGGKKSSEGFNTAGYWMNINTSGILEGLIANGTTQITLTSAAAVDDSKWHHVAIIINRTTGNSQMYLDGKLEDTDTTPTGDLSNALNYVYGSISLNSAVFPFKGKMDQAMIFNYVRSPAQIAYDYSKGTPLAYWKFNECSGSSVNDSSGNSRTGTITIGASGEDTLGTCAASSTAWGDGAIGKRNASLKLDGTDDYISVTNNPVFNINSAITLSAWINGDTLTSEDFILSRYNWTNIQGYALSIDNNKLIMKLYDGSTRRNLTSNTSLNTATWYHVVGTYDGTTMKLYINSVQDRNTTTASFSISNYNGDLEIGKPTDEASLFKFDGQIDDVKIFNYALTSTQIKNEYNGGAVNYAPVTGAP